MELDEGTSIYNIEVIDEDHGILSRSNSIRHDNLEYLYNFDFYEDKNIQKVIKLSCENIKSSLFKNIIIAAQSDNLNGLIKIMGILKTLELSKIFKSEDAKNILYILDDYIKKNFHRYDLYMLQNILDMMKYFISYKNLDLALDWKIYYQMFLICYVIPKYEFAGKYYDNFFRVFDLFEFLKIASKYFIISNEDYKYIKQESEKRLIDIGSSIGIGLLIAQLFLPAKLLAEDITFQERIFGIWVNKPLYANNVLLIFQKFIHIGIKISKEIFIEKITSLSLLLLADTVDVFSFEFPESLKNDSDISKNICYILAYILIHDDYAKYRHQAIKNWKICVQMINSFLTENTTSHSVNYSLKFIEILFLNIKKIASFKIQNVLSEVHSMCEFRIKDEFKERINEITTIMNPIISKCLFYNHYSSFSLFVQYISITDSNSLKQYMSILHYLFEKCEEDFEFFIGKLIYFSRFLLENINDKDIEKFINKIISISISKISSFSESANAKILDFFNVLFILLIEKKKENDEKYQSIVNTLNEQSITIFKKLLQLLSFFAESGGLTYYLHHYFEYINADNNGISYLKQIEELLCDYLENNQFDAFNEFLLIGQFSYYISMHDSSFFTNKIWQMCFKNLIEPSDESPPSFSFKNMNKERFIYFSTIISTCASYFDFENQTFTHEMIEYIKLCVKLPEERRKKINNTIENMLDKVLSPDVIDIFHVLDGMTVKYPSQSKLKFTIQIFNEIITPHWIKLNQAIKDIYDNCPQEMEIKKYYEAKSDLVKNSFEKQIDLFLGLAKSFIKNYDNILLKDYNDNDTILGLLTKFPEYETYIEIKKMIASCEDYVMQIFHHTHRLGNLKSLGNSLSLILPNRLTDPLLDSRQYLTAAVNFLVSYNELRYKETYYVKSRLLHFSYQKHVSMFCIHEDYAKRLASISRQWIKTILKSTYEIDPAVIRDIQYAMRFFEPDSTMAFKFIDDIMSYLEAKIEKIDISQEISNKKLNKFYNCGCLIICLINEYQLLFYDLSYSFSKLNKLRIIASKHKLFANLLDTLYCTYLTSNFKQSKANGLYLEQAEYFFLSKDIFACTTLSFDELFLILSQSSTRMTITKEEMQKEIDIEITHQTNLKQASYNAMRVLITQMLNEDLSSLTSDYLETILLDLDFIIMLQLALDIKNSKDKELLNQIEEKYLSLFFERKEEDLLKRRVFYIAITHIERMKWKLSKVYSCDSSTLLPPSSGLNPMNMKDNFSINSSRDKKYSNDFTDDNLTHYFKQATSNDFKQLISGIYSIQDQKDFDFLQENSTRLDGVEQKLFYAIFPQKRASYLDFINKYKSYKLTDSPVVWDRKITKFLFYVFNRSQFCDYDQLFQNFELLKSEINDSNFNEVAFISTLVLFLYSMIKNDLILHPCDDESFEKIRKAFKRLMGYYTYNITKRIDSEILTFFSFLVEIVSPEIVMKLFYDMDNDYLFLFNYDIYFIDALCVILQLRFLSRTVWIFSQGKSLAKLKEIIAQMMSSHVDWVKNEYAVNDLYIRYPTLSGIEEYDYRKLTIRHNIAEIKCEFNNICEVYHKEKTKESRNLLIMFISSELDYFINHDFESFLSLLGEFSFNKELNTTTFDNEINCFLFFFKDYMYKELPILPILELFLSTMMNVKSEESNQLLADLLAVIIIPRLHLIEIDNTFLFQKIPGYMQCINNKSTKKYICEIFNRILFSLEEENIQKFAQEVETMVYSESEQGNKEKSISLIMLLNIFLLNFDLRITKSTEMILIKLNKMNLKLFKNKGIGSNIIKKMVEKFYENYSTTYEYAKRGISLDCQYAIDNLSKICSYVS